MTDSLGPIVTILGIAIASGLTFLASMRSLRASPYSALAERVTALEQKVSSLEAERDTLRAERDALRRQLLAERAENRDYIRRLIEAATAHLPLPAPPTWYGTD